MKKINWSKALVSGTEWFARLAVLNLTWLLFSLPILTLVPATDALFSVLDHWRKEETEIPIFRTFWEVFRQNFWRSFKLGLPILLVSIVVLLDIWFFHHYPKAAAWLQIYKYSIYTFGLLFGLVTLYSYPLSKRSNHSILQLYLTSAYLMIGNPLYSLGLLFSAVTIFLILLKWSGLFFFFSASLLAWLATLAVDRALKKAAERRKNSYEEDDSF